MEKRVGAGEHAVGYIYRSGDPFLSYSMCINSCSECVYAVCSGVGQHEIEIPMMILGTNLKRNCGATSVESIIELDER